MYLINIHESETKWNRLTIQFKGAHKFIMQAELTCEEYGLIEAFSMPGT